MNIRYALDTYRTGRKSLEGKSNSDGENELLFIWDKFQELIDSGEITDIINGKDIIDNPLPVFTVDDGVLIESVTDKYGWPNTDDNGICMYENTHFSTAAQAFEYGLREYNAAVELFENRIMDIKEKLSRAKSELKKYQDYILHLNKESEKLK